MNTKKPIEVEQEKASEKRPSQDDALPSMERYIDIVESHDVFLQAPKDWPKPPERNFEDEG